MCTAGLRRKARTTVDEEKWEYRSLLSESVKLTYLFKYHKELEKLYFIKKKYTESKRSFVLHFHCQM